MVNYPNSLSISPTSGPVGTLVTVTAKTNTIEFDSTTTLFMSGSAGSTLSHVNAIYPNLFLKILTKRKLTFNVLPNYYLPLDESYNIIVRSSGNIGNSPAKFFLSSQPIINNPIFISATYPTNSPVWSSVNNAPKHFPTKAVNFFPAPIPPKTIPPLTEVNKPWKKPKPWKDVKRIPGETPNIYIVSDIHMCSNQASYSTPAGFQKNLSEDFDSDKEFTDFLKWIDHDSKSFLDFDKKKTVLILLGDILDIWQASSETHTDGNPLLPPPVNAANYKKSINEIIKTHQISWNGLKRFCQDDEENRLVYYVVGNHDDPLYGTRRGYRGMRKVVTDFIDSKNFIFADAVYHRFYHFWAEHGHSWDKENWELIPQYEKTAGQIFVEQFVNIMQNLGFDTQFGDKYNFSVLNNFPERKTEMADFLIRVLNNFEDDITDQPTRNYLLKNILYLINYFRIAGQISGIIKPSEAKILIQYSSDCANNHPPMSLDYLLCLTKKLRFLLSLVDGLAALKKVFVPANGISKETAKKRGVRILTKKFLKENEDPRNLEGIIDVTKGDEISLMASGHTHYAEYVKVQPGTGGSTNQKSKLYMNTGTWIKQYKYTNKLEFEDNRQIWRLSGRYPGEERRPVRQLSAKPKTNKKLFVQVPSKKWADDPNRRYVDAVLLQW